MEFAVFNHCGLYAQLQEQELLTESCARRRFTFELLPGQVPLELWAPFSIKPRHGLFVRPLLRT